MGISITLGVQGSKNFLKGQEVWSLSPHFSQVDSPQQKKNSLPVGLLMVQWGSQHKDENWHPIW